MPTKLSKSRRLRKYESVYKQYYQKNTPKYKSPRQSRRNTKKPDNENNENNKPKKEKKKVLNDYQKFVQKESKKDSYKDMTSKDRFSTIATQWEIYKRQTKKTKTKNEKNKNKIK